MASPNHPAASREDALEIAMICKDQGRERGDMGGRQRRAVANRVAIRRLTCNHGDAGRAQVEFGPAARERRHKHPARDRHGRRGLGGLRAVVRIASGLSDRANCHDMGGTGGKQHRSRGVAGRGNNADALLFCRGNTLLNQRRAARATESQARDVDSVLQAIVERRDEVAAAGIGWKLADMQLAIRRIAADAEQLASKKGRCCSDADGMSLSDVDWVSHDGHYRVQIRGEWVDVPDDAVITEPNRAGQTMVWPTWLDGHPQVRCFMPGTMS
jgi:hypothetical protein